MVQRVLHAYFWSWILVVSVKGSTTLWPGRTLFTNLTDVPYCRKVEKGTMYLGNQTVYIRGGRKPATTKFGLSVANITQQQHRLIPEKATKLMVVAHADDETIFGGSDLLSQGHKWLVVVATQQLSRVPALRKVVEFFQLSSAIMMGHLDKLHLTFFHPDFVEDLVRIILFKKWEEVVTHHPDGEYGHAQHISLSKIVATILSSYPGAAFSLRVFTHENERKEPPAGGEDGMSDGDYAKLLVVLQSYGDKISSRYANMMRRSALSKEVTPYSYNKLNEILCSS